MLKQSGLPMVSVIIPAYNEDKYISKTLDCIASQDYPNYEVIIIDNASTDKTFAVVTAYIAGDLAKIPMRLVQESRQGTQFARECGRKTATGSIIAQLDADCLPDPDWISTGVGLFKSAKVVAVTGPYAYIDCPLGTRIYTYLGQGIFYKLINSVIQLFHRGGIIIGGNAFIRAAVLESAGGYNTGLTFYGDDVDTAARVSAFGKIRYSNKLQLKTSYRRFAALGFWKVQNKYSRFFLHAVFHGKVDSKDSFELNHPR